jgi:secreted trypsin-like serine protease
LTASIRFVIIGTSVARRLVIGAAALALVWVAASPADAIVGGTAVTSHAAAPKIVGGTTTSSHAYGWMVRLSVGCDGSLIAPTVVLTAAHCVSGTGATSRIKVTGGSTDLSSPDAVTVRSSYVTRAPGFRDPEHGDDWALVQLATPLNGPLLALTPSSAYDHGQFRALGWGATHTGGAQQTRLRTVLVPYVADKACAKAYRGESFVPSDMICAGNLKHGGVDSCQGDSGGPLVRRDDHGGYVEVGIVSWGDGCAQAGYPGVYTQVSAYTSMIHTAMNRLP